jgi:hypothetical protein
MFSQFGASEHDLVTAGEITSGTPPSHRASRHGETAGAKANQNTENKRQGGDYIDSGATCDHD